MAASAGPDIVEDGLVLYLDAGNEESYPGTGTTWKDLSGNGNDATLINGAGYSTDNVGSITLDASNDYITTDTGITENDWTILLWYLNDGPTSFKITGHRTFVSSNNFRFQWDDSNSTTLASGPFVQFTSAAGYTILGNLSNRSPTDLFNKWIMVGVSSNSVDPRLRVYYNTEYVNGGTISRPLSSDGIIRLGADGLSSIGSVDYLNIDGGNVYLNFVKVYNRALSPEEVLQNYNATKSRFYDI